METSVRLAIPLLVGLFATLIGFDRFRNRAFFPLMAIIIAAYFKLLFVTGSAIFALSVEGTVLVALLTASAFGKTPDFGVIFDRLAGHGLFDVASSSPKASPQACACSENRP
jgi:hypothetical protein